MTLLAWLQSLAISLVLTLLLELGFSLIWGLRGRDLQLIVLINLLTNPLAVSLHGLLCLLWGLSPLVIVPILEGAVILTEGHFCQTQGHRIVHPWRFALLLNLFSYGMGVLLQQLIR